MGKNIVSGELTFTTSNGDGPQLLGRVAELIAELQKSGLELGIQVRISAPPLTALLGNGQAVMDEVIQHKPDTPPARIVEPTPDPGAFLVTARNPPFVNPTPAAPAKDPDKPQSEEEWDLVPFKRKKVAGAAPVKWDWGLLEDTDLRPTIVGLDLERTSWREVKARERQLILEFYARHCQRETGTVHVPHGVWNSMRPKWLPVATNTHAAYGMPYKTLMENAASWTGKGAPSGESA